MSQPFSQPQQTKKRMSLLVFLKGSTAPLVLYLEKPITVYEELLKILKNPLPVKIVEKETIGPIRRVAFLSSEIASVAIQEETYI